LFPQASESFKNVRKAIKEFSKDDNLSNKTVKKIHDGIFEYYMSDYGIFDSDEFMSEKNMTRREWYLKEFPYEFEHK
jgi:hypothetical protein